MSRLTVTFTHLSLNIPESENVVKSPHAAIIAMNAGTDIIEHDKAKLRLSRILLICLQNVFNESIFIIIS